ncbi:RDD family protein [Steroidobacter flavus]|uniref:RDD family protein n=1 Tax=Steroidobacter flavus TaxID=1842136 RepID=A0ABV8ST16_9GAMM
MKRLFVSIFAIAMLAGLGGTQPAFAQEEITPPAPPEPPAEVERNDDLERGIQRELERAEREIERAQRKAERAADRAARRLDARNDRVIVNIGDNSSLPAGEYADAVISVFGSATSAGEVGEAVVAIGGNSSATGPVGEGVVALFGNVYVDSEVGQDVVAIFGNVQLGPHAVVNGETVSVGGAITRDPASKVHGGQQQIAFGKNFGDMKWLKAWFENCLLYGRPLAFDSSVAWAWWLAFGFLGLYVLLAVMFDGTVQRCVTTLEERPGESTIATILAVLLSPILIILTLITVIGAALVPFLVLGLFCAAVFGKTVVLAALGRRITRFTGIGAFGHLAVATLIGGLIVLLLYTVPVVGFIVSNIVGALGFGVVVYTLLLAQRSRSAAPTAQPVAAAAPAASAAGFDPTIESAGIAGDGSTVPPPSPPPVSPSNVELNTLPRAGFWIRMGALTLDALIVAVVVNWLEPSGHLFLVALAGYGALMWKLKGTTIGGIVCNLRVVRTDGRDIEWETAIVRALGCFLSLIPAGLGFIWMVFDNGRQTWHDKIAGTVVVRAPKNTPLV